MRIDVTGGIKLDKKIKVLQFPVANSKGGITQYALQNWKFIDKSKFQFDFATMSKSLSFAEDLEREGCKIFYISCYAEENKEQFIKEFKKILLEGNYDVVHLHTKQWKSFCVEELAKEVNIKRIIVHAHNTGIDAIDVALREKEIGLHNRMLNLLTEDIATDFWACSKRAADFVFADKIDQKKIKIMCNAIDLERFKYKESVRMKLRDELNINNKFVIGHVGRFVYQKNHDFIIDVFSHVCKQNENAVLLLVGEGELEENIRQKVNKLQLSDKVIFMGWRKDVQDILQAMDVFVLPSKFEGLPIVAVEAQAVGLKCLCSDTITDEVKITKRLELLPLNSEQWVKRILQCDREDEYFDRRESLNLKQYDILNQIKLVEFEYSGSNL